MLYDHIFLFLLKNLEEKFTKEGGRPLIRQIQANVKYRRNTVLTCLWSETLSPRSHGEMDGAVACGARGPGFDPNFIQKVFSLGSKVVGWNQTR